MWIPSHQGLPFLGVLTDPRAAHNNIYHSVENKVPYVHDQKSHHLCLWNPVQASLVLCLSKKPNSAGEGQHWQKQGLQGGHSCHTLPCFLLHSSGKQQYTGSGQPQNAPFHICNPSTTTHQGGHKAGRQFILPAWSWALCVSSVYNALYFLNPVLLSWSGRG